MLEIGTRVIATRRIVEEDVPPDELAEPYDPGWVHAEKGDPGEVVGIDPVIGGAEEVEIAVTVRFDKSGTATLVFREEVVRA